MTKKLAIISTHPIQYYAPAFQLLAKKIELKVFYTAGNSFSNKFDHGFKQKIEWDIPLLSEYEYEFLENTAKDKGSHHYKGIVNPTAITKIEAYNPDAILIYGWANKSHLKIIRYFKGRVPVYFRGDSTLLNEKLNFKYIFKAIFLKWVYSHINTAFYVGTANKAYFKKYGLKEKQLIFAPHAIDNERFLSPRINDALKLRARFSISDEEILIIFAGKLETVKNPILLLTAFKNLNRDNVKLLFVGNGALEKELKESSHSESLKNKIHFLDFQNQSQMPTIYQACDLFCLPSISETWGLAVNEAMACSKAILVSDKVGCGPDLVIDGVNGTIFRSNDKDSLVAKLNSLCINRDNLAMLGKKSAKIISNWTFDKQVEALQSALQNI